MNSQKIYTRKTLGLDNSVWWFMVPLMLVCVALLGYRLSDQKKCTPIDFTVKGIMTREKGVYYTDETVSFSSSVKSQNIEWDFGDQSKLEMGQYVTHRFSKEGKYFVTAGVGTQCASIKEVVVKNPPIQPVVMDSSNDGEKIIGRESIFSAIEEVYVCAAIGSTYDWVVENNPGIKPIGLGSTAKISFPNPGKYTLQVTVDNNRDKRYYKEINVVNTAATASTSQMPPPPPVMPQDIPRLLPPQPSGTQNKPDSRTAPNTTANNNASENTSENAPSGTKKIAVGNVAFQGYLQKVADGEMMASDFDKYLCGGSGTKVIINGNKRDMETFDAFCKSLAEKKKKTLGVFGKKKAKITSVQLYRDENRCVTLIDVGMD